MYKVFYTVLNSVMKFFQIYPNDILFVQGSDSAKDVAGRCIQTCRKRCMGICKNANRRIRSYRNFINKHLKELQENYVFYGSFSGKNNFVAYEIGKEYEALMVRKKK